MCVTPQEPLPDDLLNAMLVCVLEDEEELEELMACTIEEPDKDGRDPSSWSNVDARPCPANGSRIYMPTERPAGLKLIGDRELTWRAMPCIACEDPSYEGAM